MIDLIPMPDRSVAQQSVSEPLPQPNKFANDAQVATSLTRSDLKVASGFSNPVVISALVVAFLSISLCAVVAMRNFGTASNTSTNEQSVSMLLQQDCDQLQSELNRLREDIKRAEEDNRKIQARSTLIDIEIEKLATETNL